MTDYYIWGMLALVLIDKYFRTEKIKYRLICAFGIFISAISYVFIMYPAWQVPLIFVYIAIFIYMVITNKKEYKFKKSDLLIIFLVILAIAGIGLRYLKMSSDALQATMNTDYPGSRFEIGGDGKKVVFSYVYSFLFPYVNIDNPCEVAGMISFFPIPIIISIIYLIRNKDRKEHLAFFIPILIVSIIFSIFTLLKTNTIFAKITLLYLTPGRRLGVILGFTQILILVYLLGIVNENKKIMNNITAKILALISSVIIFHLALDTLPTGFTLGSLKSYICGLILITFLYLLFTMNNEKNKRMLLIGLGAMAIFTGVTINPIQKGISVLTDKPLAKEVKNIVDTDSENNLWITDNTFFYMPNYLLASGAKVVNSTNVYPNFELFKIVLGEDAEKEEYRKIYNRYAHITMEITKNENKVELIYQDSIRLKLTPDKLKKLGIKYIVTIRDIEKFETNDVDFEEIYSEQGILIYKVN